MSSPRQALVPALLNRQNCTFFIVLLCGLRTNGVVIAQEQALTPTLTSSGVSLEDRANKPGLALTPRLTVSEVFSDNIELVPSDAGRSEFVTVIEPGFSLTFNGNRLDFDFDYAMQNLLYARNSEFNNTNHQLDLSATAEFFRDRLFLDINGSRSQQSINTQDQLGNDNIALTDNRRDVTSFSLSPYYTNDFSGYAETEIRYTYEIVRFSDDGTSDADLGGTSTSDAERKGLDINLSSGRRADRTTWQIDYFKQKLDRENNQGADNGTGTNDSERESFNARIDYRLSQEWRAAARGGYENNDLASRSDNENGSYWSVGGVWTPNRFFELESFYGPSENEVVVRLAPTTRTAIEVSRRDRDVGADTGEIFSGSLRHRTRFTVWTASYTEETTSTQELELASIRADDDGLVDDDGQVILPETLDGRADLTDEEFFRKRFDFTFAYSRGRSVITVNSFVEDRQFDSGGGNERLIGAEARWLWRFGARTNSFIDLSWERNQEDATLTDSNNTQNDGAGDDDLWRLGVGLEHKLSRRVNASAEYSYARRDADVSQENYRENRVTLLLRMEF